MEHLSSRYLFTAVLLLLAGFTLWGCFHKPVDFPTANGQRQTWSEMSIEVRKQHMRNEVLPRAKRIFQQWRPNRFTTVDCTLCHGPKANVDIFTMPNEYLPRLSGKLLLGPELKNDPNTTRLKLNKLVPAISEALGVKPFSILTRRGFGCYSCHLGPDGPVFGN